MTDHRVDEVIELPAPRLVFAVTDCFVTPSTDVPESRGLRPEAVSAHKEKGS